MKEEKFKHWIINNEGKKEGTARSYASAINKISEHYSEVNHQLFDIYKISELSELEKIIELYDFKGSYFEIGDIGHGTYRNALKALNRYYTNLPKQPSEVKINVNKIPHHNQTINSHREIENYTFNAELIEEAKTMSEYYEIFYCLEKSIRLLVTDIMQTNYGKNWWQIRVNLDIKKKVADNIIWEQKTGYTERSFNEIDYTTFGDLRQIIRSNWKAFSNCFKNQDALNSIMVSLNTLRVPIAHCTPFAGDEVVRLKLVVSDWFRQLKNS